LSISAGSQRYAPAWSVAFPLKCPPLTRPRFRICELHPRKSLLRGCGAGIPAVRGGGRRKGSRNRRVCDRPRFRTSNGLVIYVRFFFQCKWRIMPFSFVPVFLRLCSSHFVFQIWLGRIQGLIVTKTKSGLAHGLRLKVQWNAKIPNAKLGRLA